MKTIACATFIFLYVNSLLGQDFKKDQLNITSGVSIPYKDFAASGLDNSNLGNALIGFNLNIFVSHKFTENLGITGGYILNTNQLDKYSLQSTVEKLLPGYIFNMEKNSYKNQNILGGFLIYLPQKINSFEIRGMLGSALTIKPEIKLVGHNVNGVIVDRNTARASSSSLCYYVSGTYRIKINENFGFNVGVSYLFTRPTFNGIQTNQTSQGYTSTEINNYALKVNIINFNVGLSL